MLGLLVMLVAAGFLSIQNVLVRVFFEGNGNLGGVLPSDFEHTLLFLQTRTFFMMLFMGLIVWIVYPKIFLEIGKEKPQWKLPFLSGTIYFATVIFLYLALGSIAAGVAITLFFIHPLVAMLLGWRREPPTLFRWVILAGVMMGLVLVTPQLTTNVSSSQFTFGVVCALVAGVGFALYAVTAQNALVYFHPISFSLITFTVLFGLASVVRFILPLEVSEPVWERVLLWSAGSGLITLGGLVFTNLGIRLVGAPTATLVGSTEPALTAIVAWLLMQEALTLRQTIGISIVTLSIGALGFIEKD